MKKSNLILSLFLSSTALLFTSCSDDDDVIPNSEVEVPDTYNFERDGASTVSYDGQTTRLLMGEDLKSSLTDNTLSESELLSKYAHQQNDDDFSDPSLNASGKNLRSKTAASADYFSANTTESIEIKNQIDEWISKQATEVFPNWNTTATPGQAGQIQQAGGGRVRYVNAKGFEYNQMIVKSLIGAVMTDQMLNNYLSPAVLDEGDNIANNDNGITAQGKIYTTMEHKWDEAFGYLYGLDNAMNPQLDQDSFLNEYLDRVEGDPDFAGIADDIYDAFKLGRAAIVAGNYDVRDQQAQIIREKISQVIAVRAVYYLEQGKMKLATDQASAFHGLSEAFGFIYSLQFTRNIETGAPYFNKSEVEVLTNQLLENNGLWDVTEQTLESIAQQIAARFDFTVDQAKS